jgi:hypothetical protein
MPLEVLPVLGFPVAGGVPATYPADSGFGFTKP